MTGVRLRHGAATDVGLVREINEDAYLAAPPAFVVADGMGGHDRGDIASRIVVAEFARAADVGYDLDDGREFIATTLRACRARIATYDEEQRAAGAHDFAAGTTAVVALLLQHAIEPSWLLANLGDSRIYRRHRGVLQQISVDHSVVQELIEAGAITEVDAAVHPERHIITRALGGRGSVEADYFVLPVAAGDRLMLCSDGVNGLIHDDEISQILTSLSDPLDAAEQVVAAAVAAGGHDNATAVVVDVVGLVDEQTYDSDA